MIESSVLRIIEKTQALNRKEVPQSVKPDNVTGYAELHGFFDVREQVYV